MRDYLYIWHDPDKQFIVASGVEFKDFKQSLNGQDGLILIEHQSEFADRDSESGFDFVSSIELSELMNEDIYSWGNFTWVDYKASTFPKPTDIEVSELLFFAHKAQPLNAAVFTSLHNKFMAYIHDDGWYLKLYYSHWAEVETLINTAISSPIGKLDISELKLGSHGYWLRHGEVIMEEKTHAIDLILNRRL